ncbi:hypothetical protein AWR27_20295 [Spirosoma montaniterrae]|uniref:Uncharacterized protein n=2 Tax=Spirosoma montaniterrae TaxID=1178516 RepID=A0A1P9X1E9_9BACT|nr:hypothetical protein AWR27_20295 [Spirosoma montaniterrae]
MPAYYGYLVYPARVGIVIPSLKGKSVGERIGITSGIAREVLSAEERALVNALLPFTSSEEMNENFDERIARVMVEHAWPD